MRETNKHIVSLVIFLCCASCQRDLKPVDYVRYINDRHNNCSRITQIDGWEFCMIYRPYSYIMLMENKGNLKDYDMDKRTKELQGTAWFSISMKRIDNSVIALRYHVASLEEYNTRLSYYLNDANKDIRLIYGTDTLTPETYLFENNYNLAPHQTMIIGFYLPNGATAPGKDMKLSFVDRIFKTGIINASYSKENINSIPNLIY